MMLTVGSRIGPYEIVAPLGAGGMGEVYRARDTSLHRDVALKVLPPSFATDPDRLARFRREAQSLAALNHPNVAQVYGLDESTGVCALAMELVSGQDLSQIIARQRHSAPAAATPSEASSRGVAARGRGAPRALNVDDGIAIAKQIAEALEAAHEAGIIHRDLKPANVMVRDDGTVKVLDFGLAKALESSPRAGESDIDLANSPTFTHQGTEFGVILGTAAYMAPEQAKGRAVDKRADIWAFGCLLYEMLTGERAFGGDTVQETLASVIKDPPRLERLPANVPPHIQRLVARCLDRDPRTRLRDIGEARVALGKGAELDTTAGAPPPRPARRSRPMLAVLGSVLAGAAISAFVVWQVTPSATIPSRRFELPPVIAKASGSALSRDGGRLAYLTDRHLFIHNFADASVLDLGVVPPAAHHVFWSPDGRTIAYSAEATLRTRPAAGGPDFVVCKLPGAGRVLGAAWTSDNTILFAAWRDSIYRVPASGGTPALAVAINPATDVDFHNVVALPDGRLIVARHVRADDREHLEIVDRGASVPLTDDPFVDSVMFMQPRDLLFVRRGAHAGLWAVPFDKPPIDFAHAVRIAPDATVFDASPEGTLVYVVTPPKKFELAWVTRQGAASPIPGGPVEQPEYPAISRDGSRLLFVMGSDSVIVVRDLESGMDTRVTQPKTDASQQTMRAQCPTWFPSGDRILYTWGSAEAQKMLSKEPSGGGAREVGTGACGIVSGDSRDVYYMIDERGRGKLYRAPLDAAGVAGKPTLVLPPDDESDVCCFDISPQGDLLVYGASEPGGRINIWLMSLSNAGARWQITTAGGNRPNFSADGSELFYMAPASDSAIESVGALMAVAVTTKPAVRFGAPQKLFLLDDRVSTSGGYTVARDGRFLFARPTPSAATDASRAFFVQNSKTTLQK